MYEIKCLHCHKLTTNVVTRTCDSCHERYEDMIDDIMSAQYADEVAGATGRVCVRCGVNQADIRHGRELCTECQLLQ